MRLIDADELKKELEISKYIMPSNLNRLLNSEINRCIEAIDNAPTVELFCSYLSDGEVRQPCVEAPCKHERPQGDLISREALKKDFKDRLEKAKNWKENALNRGEDEIAIRADATLAFICEVIMTINNAPTVSEITKEKLSIAYEQGYEDGKKNWLQEERPQGEFNLKELEGWLTAQGFSSGTVEDKVKEFKRYIERSREDE